MQSSELLYSILSKRYITFSSLVWTKRGLDDTEIILFDISHWKFHVIEVRLPLTRAFKYVSTYLVTRILLSTIIQ